MAGHRQGTRRAHKHKQHIRNQRGTNTTNGLKYKTGQQGEPMTHVTRQSGENTEQVWAWGAGRQKTKDETRLNSKTQTPELKTQAGMTAAVRPYITTPNKINKCLHPCCYLHCFSISCK
ncbi:hypothetical protein ILYODFUR_034389 [Ilyodon furcidens]|uniref:Uncharacterized protein n=1 Tax=Ilyodon furcidens TaxID=33524 RepID=A0ABV0UQ82_9TELE